MQAEILRELGEFDQALGVLSAPLPDGFEVAERADGMPPTLNRSGCCGSWAVGQAKPESDR